MAKKNKKSFFSRAFRSIFFKKEEAPNVTPKKKMPQSFQIEWKNASEKWKQLLLTKQVEAGLVIERAGYRLHKTNDKIFRLEGDSFSILLATGNTLYTGKDGKISGILFVEEGNLNKTIQTDFSKLENLLSRLDLPKADMDFVLSNEKLNDWHEIFAWEKFWKEQLILQLSSNSMALTILALGEELKIFLESNATPRQISFVRDEFFFLNSGKISETNYPHGKNKNWYGFSQAVDEFSRKIDLIRVRREKENGT